MANRRFVRSRMLKAARMSHFIFDWQASVKGGGFLVALIASAIPAQAFQQLEESTSQIISTAETAPSETTDLKNADQFYEENRVIDVVIEMEPESWSKLSKQMRDIGKAFTGESSSPFTWFKGTVTIDGRRIESVGIRKKGFIGSLDEFAPSLKVDFSRYVEQAPIDDVEVLTLNNNKQDESLLSQTLAYRIFAKAGVAAPRTNFAKVTVNGTYLGLYSNVEGIDKTFLKRQFGSHDGDLYEGTITDFYPRTISKIERKNNKKKKDRPRLDQLATVLSEDNPADGIADEPVDLPKVGSIVDIDNFLRYWATESLLAFWDGYSNNQNNYWFYDDPRTGKIRFVPWGADMTMEISRGMPQFGSPGPASVYAQSYLANRLIHHPEISSRYRDTMQDLLDEVWDEKVLLEQIDALEQVAKPHLGDRQKSAAEATDRLRTFVKTRRSKVQGELKNWPVRFPEKPRKPAYQVNVGSLKGQFTTQWSSRPQHGPTKQSTLFAHANLDGTETKFIGQGAAVYAKSNMRFPFGPPGPREPQVEFLLTGNVEGADKPTRILVVMDQARFEANDPPAVEVTGQYFDSGNGPGFMPFSNKSVRGTLKLDKSSTDEGGAVEGEFEFQIWQLKGGFFDRGEERPNRNTRD